jgi:uncharacterized integral membrane protein
MVMVRIIVSVVFLVLLAVFVSLNLEFKASVNLFGARFDNVSVVAVAALSFALGIVYSLIIYVGRFFKRRAVKELATRKKSLTEREKQLASREPTAGGAPGPAPAEAEPQTPARGIRAAASRFLRSLGGGKPRE